MPPKAIPPARDRLQSRWLVWIFVPALCYACFQAFRYAPASGGLTAQYRWGAILIALCFAYAAWRLKAATPFASACGAMVAYLVTVSSSIPDNISVFHSGLAPLFLLFALTFTATRFGQARADTAEASESHGGRNAGQIIANLGIAAWISSPPGLKFCSMFVILEVSGRNGHRMYVALISIPMLAALAEATADTVSSEIGQAFGGQPILLTSLRRVPPGTDGAISLKGTLAGIAAAALIAATGAPALGMSATECTVAFAAGVAGLFFDSLLGATLERRGWIGNDFVNFTSTAFAAAVALLAIRFAQPYLLR